MSQLAVFSHRNQITPTTWSYFFTTDKPLVFTAGQYLRWTAPIEKEIKRGNKRLFTISSLPGEDTISFTTRFLEPVSPFKAFLQKLDPGDSMDISQPMGDFTLPEDATILVLLLAGGIGVTPFRSMILSSIPSSQRSIQLVHGAKDASELAFREEFEKFNPNYPHLSLQYHSNIADEATIQGHISAQNVIAHAPEGCKFYISGPEPFVEALQSDIIAGGIKETNIKTDFFPGYIDI